MAKGSLLSVVASPHRIHHRPATIFSNRVSPVLPRNVWAVGLDLPTLDYMLLIGS
jgi:hypothetical protein